MSMSPHYDQHYFYMDRFGGKRYKDSSGQEKEFGYTAGGLWNFQSLLGKLIELLGKPTSVLDLGAGCGGFIATCNSNGIEGVGLEFSEYAVKNPILGAGKYLKLWDLEQIPWPIEHKYTWITMIDLMEHLFSDRVDEVIKETKRVAEHFIIAKICTAQKPNEVYAAKRGPLEEVMEQSKKDGFEWLTVSGHVNSQFPKYWCEKFEDEDWKLRDDLSEKLKEDLSLPLDWRTTLILEKQSREPIPELPREFTSGWYGKDYFAVSGGKRFHRPDGSQSAWSYANPSGEWEGAKAVAEAWKTIFKPKNMLDVAAGRGTFIAYARDAGIEAEGFDYSEWAVSDEGRYPRCKKEWLRLHDATKPWPYQDKSFDLVTCLDTLEHIYESDLKAVLDELFRVAGKYVFLLIAVPGKKREFILKKGEAIPLELEELAVAGHVTYMPEQWWYDRLDREDWLPRRDLVQWFTGILQEPSPNWLANSIIILSRVGVD